MKDLKDLRSSSAMNAMKVLFLVVVVSVIFSGSANAFDGKTNRIEVHADRKVITVTTDKPTVSDVLDNLGIPVLKDDVVSPPMDAEITDDMKIFVSRSFLINVSVDGEVSQMRVIKDTVGSIKKRVDEKMDAVTKLVGAEESDPLESNMTIKLVTSYTEREEVSSDIPFEVIYTTNENVFDDEPERVLFEGRLGTLVTVNEKLFEGDTLVSTTVVGTRVETPPVDKVIEKGTKPRKVTVPGTDLAYTKVLTMRASAYTSDRGDSGTHTATGERARVGLVAVDPKFIPLGTRLYVVGYGECRAADTGGMIKGNAIDLFFNTYGECTRFGRQEVTVYILE